MNNNFTLLTFALDKAWYAIRAEEVREVVPLPELTPLMDAPQFVSGIFNLRGRIVTAINLRRRIGLMHRAWDIKNAVLVTIFQKKLYGLIVNEALSLITILTQDMEPAPDLPSLNEALQSQCFSEIAKLEGRLVPILNLNSIFKIVDPGSSAIGSSKETMKDKEEGIYNE